MSMQPVKAIFIFLMLLLSTSAQAHEGHTHSSPTAASHTKLGSGSTNSSPLSVGIKLRSGYEFGSYLSGMPSLSTFLGSDELSLTLAYEFQFKEYTAANQQTNSDYSDRVFNNQLSTLINRKVSDDFALSISFGYEQNEAVRLERALNDSNYTSVNPNISYMFEGGPQVIGGYLFGYRKFPNGTYTTPPTTPSGIGEPINPIPQNSTPASAITTAGIADIRNEFNLILSGELGEQTLSLEGRYLTHNSDVSTREYKGQSLKLSTERMLGATGLFGQAAYAIENRQFSDTDTKIQTTEIGLQKELSARLSISGLATFNTTNTALVSNSWSETYAQLQYAF